jgi:hypothetical protein
MNTAKSIDIVNNFANTHSLLKVSISGEILSNNIFEIDEKQ